MSKSSLWEPDNPDHVEDARAKLNVWPLDEYNAVLLNEVHPRDYATSTDKPHEIYDLIAIGAGAGGLVSSKQSARRGAKSCMISEHLAGGDCLNVGCVPSKGLIRAARAIREVKRSADFGVVLPGGGASEIKVDFAAIMSRMRRLRAKISPADGHDGTSGTGAHVFQGKQHTAYLADNSSDLKIIMVPQKSSPLTFWLQVVVDLLTKIPLKSTE